MQPDELKALYVNDLRSLLEQPWKDWRRNYLRFVQRVQNATRDEWMTPKFQQYLWESDELSGVGMGTSVVLTTAYADRDVAEALWAARQAPLPEDTASRGDAVVATYEKLLALVTPRHNKRRPSAKLVRALGGIFPRDVLCLVDDHKTKQVRSALALKKQGEHFLKQHVRVRAELRKHFGDDGTLEQAIERSIFAWLLYERAARAEEEAAGGTTTASIPPQAEAKQPAPPPLRLLPREQQYLGITHVKDALRLMYAIVRDAEHGIARRDLVANIQAEAPYLSAQSAAIQIGIARERLGLLELHDGDVFRPTSLGKELHEGESASSVLAPVFIRRVWGFAQLLDALHNNPSGLGRAAIGTELRKRHGSWTTDMTASHILEWCRALELVEEDPEAETQIFWLSAEGEELVQRFPADLSPWDSKAQPDASMSNAETDAVDAFLEPLNEQAFVPVPFSALASRFEEESTVTRLVLPKDLLALLHGALHAVPHKRFVLLSGLSGTGKTSLAEAYARAYCAAAGVPWREHLLRVPVSPEWSDPSGLLGYVSPLGAEPTFQGTQTLELLLLAARNRGKPYFLCLDEMNLARVEHYFAPFLSAMEGDKTDLVLHGSRDAIDNVPAKISWPKNLFIIGTVNMDETTHAFSDKVLDRAFSFELWDVDLAAWKSLAEKSGVDPELLDTTHSALLALHEALRPARRHFGYRVCDEVLGFCAAVPAVARLSALDAAVLAKVLPKVRGDDSGNLPSALATAESVCQARGLSRSAEKIATMRDSLKSLGVVRFSS